MSSPRIHRAVWHLVVCLALDAMEYGRRLLWTRRHSPDWPDPGPDDLQVLRDNLPIDVAVKYLSQRILTGRLDILTVDSDLAAARLWCNSHDFAATHRHHSDTSLVCGPAGPSGPPFQAASFLAAFATTFCSSSLARASLASSHSPSYQR